MASYWPNANTEGGRIRNMYDRIANPVPESTAASQTEPSNRTEGPTANGQTNGVTVKQE